MNQENDANSETVEVIEEKDQEKSNSEPGKRENQKLKQRKQIPKNQI